MLFLNVVLYIVHKGGDTSTFRDILVIIYNLKKCRRYLADLFCTAYMTTKHVFKSVMKFHLSSFVHIQYYYALLVNNNKKSNLH